MSEREIDSDCICGHTESRHSARLGIDCGCRRCDCQHFIARDCICGEINARHCPVHGGVA